jgi:peptidoglycan/LPS O-acetylase OafA/YrhL
VRGIAIFLVVLWHYGIPDVKPIPGTVDSYILQALSLSWSGVDLFFVLSGYLIGGILLDHIDEQNWSRVFYIRRFLRIVPLYGLLIGVTYAADSRMPFIYYLTFTQNIWIAIHSYWPDGVTWSLAVEEQFYVLLPLLVWLLPRRWLPAVLAALIIIAPICRVSALNYFDSFIAPGVLFPCRMDSLLCGVLCAYAMRQEKFREWLFRNRATLYFIFALSLTWPVLATLKGWGWASFEMDSFGFTLLAVTYSCFLLIVIVERSGPVAWLTNLTPLRRLGLLAYCIYLIHRKVQYAFLSNFTGPGLIHWVLWGVIILSVLGIAEMSWCFFEGPLTRLGRRWTYSGPVISSLDAKTAIAASSI